MKVELKGFVVFGQYEHEARWAEKPYFKFSDYEPGEGFVVVKEETITVEVPDDFDPRPKMVEKLQEEIKKAEAAFAKRVTELNAQINSILAIEA